MIASPGRFVIDIMRAAAAPAFEQPFYSHSNVLPPVIRHKSFSCAANQACEKRYNSLLKIAQEPPDPRVWLPRAPVFLGTSSER
ncbi:Uncharacterised protein [Chromobacterium violaceum]|uniref:Uncharacterized protein n=1 Tax=Chromobacterium violaceum TaxID=536 RepID=A0A3S4LNH0_CHRVL|nr:Uncharacterised protein [Chromobacterium violaceum]